MEIYIIAAIGVIILAALLYLILRRPYGKAESLPGEIAAIRAENRELRRLIMEQQNMQQQSTLKLAEALNKSVRNMEAELLKNAAEGQLALQKTAEDALLRIQNANDCKLQEIQANVNDKLDKSLNERLDSSFRQIGDQLSTLYKSLGELQALSAGVTDLRKTLANVKTRGIFGEIQLKNLLADIMDSSQYAENIATKENSADRVEFAVKIPDKENPRSFIYLPIDSKFPADIYGRLTDAAAEADTEGLRAATAELTQRIKGEARTIRDKYIDPPATTDFAIMFLPTEGLYAEVIRIPGLAEWCRNECKIVLAGPTTLAALLNSLSIGFQYLTVNKNAEDVLRILQAVKAQYNKFAELIANTRRRLQSAQRATDELQKRSELIQSKLGRIETMDSGEADRLLEMPPGDYPE